MTTPTKRPAYIVNAQGQLWALTKGQYRTFLRAGRKGAKEDRDKEALGPSPSDLGGKYLGSIDFSQNDLRQLGDWARHLEEVS